MLIQEHIPLAPYTIYKIGGPARYFAEAKTSNDLADALGFAAEHGIRFFILGAGSNIVVNDKGFDGLIIRMMGGAVRAQGEKLIVDSGVMMARAAAEAARAGLAGFEWAIGVPGTIGGSVRGNAGCFGGEMKDVVESVEIFDNLRVILRQAQDIYPERSRGTTHNLRAQQCEFGYRDSIFKRHPDWVILSVTLALQKDDPAVIQERIRAITKERASKQDIGMQCAGCIFKNIPWDRKDINREFLVEQFPELAQFRDRATIPAAYLIDAAGLKGRRVGRVVISPKHANFFVNEGGATADEVAMLISIAKDTVMRKFGIAMEEEIQYVGF